MIYALLIILFVVAFGYILEPMYRKSMADTVISNDRANLEIKKKLLIEGLRDLDLDHSAHKMEEDAYHAMRKEMIQEGAHVVEELESIEGKPS